MGTRGRLFWKILLGFWLIFLLITQMLWVVFSIYGSRHEPPEDNIARRIVNLQLSSAASVLARGGMPALQGLLADWPDNEKQFLSLVPAENALPVASDPPGRAPLVYRDVTGADGQQYRLRYDIKGLRDRYHSQRNGNGSILHMPAPLFWLGMAGGLLFSLLLAWNLTRPMRQLRSAFERMSRGDLTVRLLPVMRRRHDEITEVAKDFDAMAERLQVLVSDREALLHDVSHELRSPLARLQLAIGLAYQNPANVQDSLQRIEQESGRLDKMIGELLALSRAEHQGLVGEEYFDLLGLVEAVTIDARYEGQMTGVDIQLVSAPLPDYTVKGHAEMMRRAVENVVRNGLRFSAPGQTMRIQLASVANVLEILVSDQGPGVEESKLSSIFDAFVRVNSPLAGKGYGLGLAITRKVILAHGGQVEARNGPAGGLQIRIRLPHWQPVVGDHADLA